MARLSKKELKLISAQFTADVNSAIKKKGAALTLLERNALRSNLINELNAKKAAKYKKTKS